MSNSLHSSFSQVYVAPMPSDNSLPLAWSVASPWVKLSGLISVETNLNDPTQIDDTEQESAGGYKEYYAGRGEPLTASMTFSYNRTKLSALFGFLPTAIELRTQPGYGNILFQVRRIDGSLLRSKGYLKLGASDKDEDGRQTIDCAFQGSGPPVLILAATESTLEGYRFPGGAYETDLVGG